MVFQFGSVTNPFNRLAPGTTLTTAGDQGQGLFSIANNLVEFAIVMAGLFAFWNLISAGYMFMSAGGDSKAVAKAWDKIWQSIVGLLIVAASFILAAIFGWLIFRDPAALLTPRILTP